MLHDLTLTLLEVLLVTGCPHGLESLKGSVKAWEFGPKVHVG